MSIFSLVKGEKRGTYYATELHTRIKKGKSLPKKSGGILCEGNRLEAYRFIEQHHNEFVLRWLLRRFDICPQVHEFHPRIEIYRSPEEAGI